MLLVFCLLCAYFVAMLELTATEPSSFFNTRKAMLAISLHDVVLVITWFSIVSLLACADSTEQRNKPFNNCTCNENFELQLNQLSSGEDNSV